MSIRRMMLFTLGGFFKSIISLFKTRVLSVGGNFEAETNLENQLNTLESTLFDSASLIITPNAYKEQTLYSIKPDKVGNNLLLWSEQFDNSYWNKTRCSIVSNQEIAPNGTLTADYVVEDNTTGLRYVGVMGIPTSIGQTYTFSIFVKKKDRSQIVFQINEGGSLFPTVKFDFDSQVFTQTTPLLTSSFQSVGNGWFRIILTRTPTTGTSTIFGIHPVNVNEAYGSIGDGVSRTIIWGAQFEYGSTATEYISTTDRAIVNGTIGDLTVTRATTATRVNEQGLIETVPYNLITYSEEFENSQWIKSNITIAQNSIISPNGDMTGDKLIEGTNNGYKYIQSSGLGTVGIIHTASIYLKANTRTWAYLTFGYDGSGDRAAYFNLIDGVVGNLEGGVTASIMPIGNGWYRCTITGTMLNNAPRLAVLMATGNGTRFYLGDGVSSIYAWGAQLVNGTELKPYQPTTNRLNVPRIDYSNGSPAILVEPQRTNVHLNSSTMWNMLAFASSDGRVPTKSRELNITSPTGNNDAVVVVGGNGSTGSWGIYQTMSTVINSGQQVTVSVFAKAGSNNFILLNHANISFTGSGSAYFNLSNGTTPTNGARIEDWGNGWYRCIMPTITLTANTSGAYNVGCYVTPSMSTNIWTTDYTGKSVYFFGIQVEAGSNATSYIPTTTSSVTRNADLISKTGIIDLIGQTEGTIYIDFFLKNINQGLLANIDVGAISNYINIEVRLNSIVWLSIRKDNNTPIYLISTSGVKLGNNKIVIFYKSNNYKIFLNGINIGNLNNPIFPSGTLSRMSLSDTSYGYFNNFYNTVAFWKTQLTDQQAIQLTTL